MQEEGLSETRKDPIIVFENVKKDEDDENRCISRLKRKEIRHLTEEEELSMGIC